LDTYRWPYLAPVAKQIDSPVSDPNWSVASVSFREICLVLNLAGIEFTGRGRGSEISSSWNIDYNNRLVEK